MKKIIFIMICLIPIVTFSQNSKLNTLFDKYSGTEGYTSIHITKYMFQLFAEISNEEEDKDFKDVTSKLNAIKILTVSDDANSSQKQTFKNDIIKNLPKSEYKDLMIIREGKKKITFMIREADKKIAELLMFVDEMDKTVLIYLDGDIDLKKVSKISKSMKIDGFEHLEKVEKKTKEN